MNVIHRFHLLLIADEDIARWVEVASFELKLDSIGCLIFRSIIYDDDMKVGVLLFNNRLNIDFISVFFGVMEGRNDNTDWFFIKLAHVVFRLIILPFVLVNELLMLAGFVI
jgi:hypothetical protein